MYKRRCNLVSWTTLPPEIISKISKHLKTLKDINHFRQTCQKWKNNSKPSKNLLSSVFPITITTPKSSNSFPFHNSSDPLVLQVSSICMITQQHCGTPCMILVEESKPGKVQLRHPLKGKRVRNTIPGLDLNRVNITEIAREFNFKYGNFLHKVVISSVFSDIEVMVLYYEGLFGKVKLGLEREDDNVVRDCDWSCLSRSGTRFRFQYLDDIVLFKEMCCGVDRYGRVYKICPKEMTIKGLLVDDPLYKHNKLSSRRKRLVVDSVSMELHLVERMHVQARTKVQFRVYKLNEGCKRWDAVESLGKERVLFVGNNGHCFFARAKDFATCEGNCIVFAANCFTQYTGRDTPDESLFSNEGVDVGVYQFGKGDNFSLLSSAFPEFASMIWPPPIWLSTKREVKDEVESVSSTPPNSDEVIEVNSNSTICLSDNTEEELLSENSDVLSTSHEDDDDDEELEADSPSEKASEPSYSSDSSGCFVREVDQKRAQTNDEPNLSENTKPAISEPVVCEQTPNKHSHNVDLESEFGFKEGKIETFATIPDFPEERVTDVKPTLMAQTNDEPNLSDNTKPAISEPIVGEQTPNKHSHDVALESEFGFKEGKIETSATFPDFPEERVTDVKPTPTALANSSAHGKCYSTIKFQGIDIRAELIPTLETICAKHGSLIGSDTVRSKKILASALEELAESAISLKYTTARALTDSQADDLMSNLLDFQRQGLKVDWLVPIVNKAVNLHNNKSIIESITELDKEIAKLDEKEREFLAHSAKLKQELKVRKASLCSRVSLPETITDIDLDEFLGKGLW